MQFNENKMGIYYIKNVVNNKCYVGKSIGINKRLRDHKKRLNGRYHFNQKLQRAWIKYGEHSFEFGVLEYCAKENLSEAEIKWIHNLDSRVNGYNMTDGGDGCLGRIQTEETREKLRNAFLGKPGHKHSEEHKRWLSERFSGENNPRYGKPISDENRRNLSRAMIERLKHTKHPSLGLKATPETRKKMSEARRGSKNYFYGKTHSEESRRKMTEIRKTMYKGGDNPRARKVICNDIVFDTMKDCAKYLGVCKNSMINWLHGKNKIPEKYKHLDLRFLEEDDT